MSKIESPSWHVLDFYCDDNDSCALTIFAQGSRLHIIADSDKLAEDSEIGAEYRKLVQDYQNSNPNDQQPPESENEPGSSDSGIDVTNDNTPEAAEQADYVRDDPEATLQTWMVAPLLDSLNELTKTDSSPERTLQAWYNGPTRFCELRSSEDGSEVEAVQLEATDGLDQRLAKLLPSMVLPKYISDKLNVPTYHADDLIVLSESDQPPGTPYHPCRVRHHESKQVSFLKVVDNNLHPAVKREIDVLRQIGESKLSDEINVPSLEGIVMFDKQGDKTKNGQQRIMGFLQTDILNPTPLTLMLDPKVPQAKRDRWAKEADDMKCALHEHGIIWGDAKADNFVVDKEEKLWIIDFGGSYTEGWVDKELFETEEGDDQGTAKIVNALRDPVANTQGGGAQVKRKRSWEEDEDEEEIEDERPAKQGRKTTNSDT